MVDLVSLKSEVDKMNNDNSETVPVDLSKLIEVVKVMLSKNCV